MAKPWKIVGGTGYDLEPIDNAQSRDVVCPSCDRTGRFEERMLIKNLKLFGVSLIGVEEGRRVFVCPSCNTAVEPPNDAGLSDNDPRVVTLRRKLHLLDEDVDLWQRRAELALKRGDDVLAADARKVADKSLADALVVRAQIAKLTAWDDVLAEQKPVVLAGPGEASIPKEGPSMDKAFTALKSKISGLTGGGDAEEPVVEPVSGGAGNAVSAAKLQAISQAADDDFAALKGRLAMKKGEVSVPETRPQTGEPTVAAEPLSDQSRDDREYGRPVYDEFRDERMSEFSASSDHRAGPYAPEVPTDPPKPEAPTDPLEDDDPVLALRRRLRGS
ncbi:MAG: hypothetical protein Q8Q09_24455 [Deltaproteobacteria bacterium]|nr:hypothetical protein [Deltaproteobacteria bacterium]